MAKKKNKKKPTIFHAIFSLSAPKIIAIIIIVGLAVFYNSLFNGFVLDDFRQIVDNGPVHSLKNVPSFFQGSTYNPYINSGRLVGLYYRPLMTVSFSLIYSFFGAQPFSFHLLQVLLHISNSILIFYFISFFFSKRTSLFLALIFLIHPINVEAVSSIPAFQEVLFTFFGVLALIINNRWNKRGRKYSYILIFMLLLFSLLSKESGILYVIILPIFSLLFTKGGKILAFVPSIFSLIFYLFLRLVVAEITIPPRSILPYGELPILEKAIILPKIIFSYFQTFTAPIHLVTAQLWTVKKVTFHDFFLPLIMVCLIFSLLIFLGFYIYSNQRKNFKVYLFFLTWFLIGMILNLNIDVLDAIVADRWFYFPIIGLLGLITLGIGCIRVPKKIEIVFFFALIPVVIGLSIRTFIRNTNWKSTYSIVTHDIRYHQDNWFLHYTLAVEYSKAKKYKESIPHYRSAYNLSHKSKILSDLGVIYARNGEFDKSKKTFIELLNNDPEFALGYSNYGYLMLSAKDLQKAKEIAGEGLALFPNNARLLVLMAIVDYQMGDIENSVQFMEEAYRLVPDRITKELLDLMRKKQSIEKYL